MESSKRTVLIKTMAHDLGFSHCGISKAAFLEEEAPKFEDWLKKGYHGKMDYLANHFDKRLDPTKLVPNAKSVISLLYNYSPSKDFGKNLTYKIAKYAYGQDYHYIIKKKLKKFLQLIHQKIGEVHGRIFVDSAPVHERAWAKRSGIGWIGKNSLLINKQKGSYFFLAELITDLELDSDGAIRDYCGTCNACQEACPTNAISDPYVVDGSKCISYLTIELKENIPQPFKKKMENWIFGCDICQDVCPWNRFSSPHQEAKFEPQGWQDLSKKEWQEMTEEVFQQVFKKSPLKRIKFSGLKRNLKFISSNKR